MKTTKNLMIIFIIVILLTSISCNAFLKRKVITTKIYDEEIEKAVLSPDRKRLLIINDLGEIVLFDAQKEEIITRYDMVTEEYVIYKHSVDWSANNKICLTKHYLNLDEKDVIVKKYVTEDFRLFKELYQYGKNNQTYLLSNTKKVAVIQDDETYRIKIRYSDGNTWDTGSNSEITGYSWSNGDKYVFLDYKKETYLLDTQEQKIEKLNKYFSGKWAPTRSMYCFYTDFEARNFHEKGIYIFNAEDLSYIKLNTNIELLKNPSRTWSPAFLWSPNSRYIVIPDVGEMFLFDTYFPQKKPKILVEFDGQIDENRITWSKDLKHVLFSYETRSINVLKPFNFYVARVNIDTGKMESLYISGLLYKEFFWIDDNTIIYRVDHDNGLYKSELKW